MFAVILMVIAAFGAWEAYGHGGATTPQGSRSRPPQLRAMTATRSMKPSGTRTPTQTLVHRRSTEQKKAVRGWEQSWRKELRWFLQTRRSRKRIHAQALFTREWQEWNRLLVMLKQTLPYLSRSSLQRARYVLENEGDLDRNRFSLFPESLSRRIIRYIVAIDLRYGAYPKAAVQTSSSRASGSGTKGLGGSQGQAKEGETTAWGHEESLSQMLRGGKKPVVDESKLPPLVFTQRDLERFQTSRTLISWPTARRRVGSGFGWRLDPFTKKPRFHNGIDIGSPFGSPVWAAAEGYVWRTGWFRACGLGVVIRHHRGMMTYYCHLSQILAPVGQWVQRGELIGHIGSTGRSTGPHLHFGLALQGKSVDPTMYLP